MADVRGHVGRHPACRRCRASTRVITQSWPNATLMPCARISATRIWPRRFG